MLSPERHRFVAEAISKGIFVRSKVRAWTAKIKRNVSLKATDMPELPPGITRHVHQLKVPELRGVNHVEHRHTFAVKYYGFKTHYGTFVPEDNMKPFLDEMRSIDEEVVEIGRGLVENFGKLQASIAEQYAVVVDVLWRQKYEHDGEPTDNFREELTGNFLATLPGPAELAAKFGTEVTPFNPLLDPDRPHAELIGVREHNMRVCRAVYDEILRKRRAIAAIVLGAIQDFGRKRPADRIFKRLFAKLTGYRHTVFYDDPELIRLIDAVRDLAIVNAERRTPQAAAALLDGIADHIEHHKFFLVGNLRK